MRPPDLDRSQRVAGLEDLLHQHHCTDGDHYSPSLCQSRTMNSVQTWNKATVNDMEDIM